MFREMRRNKQEIPTEECVAVLNRGTSGVLAVSGDDGYPYAVPLSYVYRDSKIYFHCAKSGHKLDGIRRNSKVSFCVTDQDKIVPEEYTSYYRSVIVFGKARIIEEEKEIRESIGLLARKYSPEIGEEARQKEIEKYFPALCMVELSVEHMTGKEARELAMKK